MFKYCDHCESVVEVTEGKCCSCGQQLTSDDNGKDNKYYLLESNGPNEQLEPLWEQACRLMVENDLNAAGKLCSKITSISPSHNDAKNMQEEIQTRSRRAGQFYEAIKAGIGKQPLNQLTSLLNEAVKIYPNHVDGHLIQMQLLSATTEYKSAMQEGIKAVGAGHWQEALTNFEKAGQLSPGFPTITRLINFINKVHRDVETARSNIDAALNQGNKSKAISLARSVDQFVEKVKNTGKDRVT